MYLNIFSCLNIILSVPTFVNAYDNSFKEFGDDVDKKNIYCR